MAKARRFALFWGFCAATLRGGGGNLPRIFLGSPEQQKKKRLVWLCPFVVLVWGLAQSGPEGSDLSVTVSGTEFWRGTRVLSHSITHATIRAKMGTPTPPQAPGCMGRWVRTPPGTESKNSELNGSLAVRGKQRLDRARVW